jgi:hypothetical protein
LITVLGTPITPWILESSVCYWASMTRAVTRGEAAAILWASTRLRGSGGRVGVTKTITSRSLGKPFQEFDGVPGEPLLSPAGVQ